MLNLDVALKHLWSLVYLGIKTVFVTVSAVCVRRCKLVSDWSLTGARGRTTTAQWFQLMDELFLLLSTVGWECLTLKHDWIAQIPKVSK